MHSLVWFTFLFGAMALPAHACPVCGFGRDGTTSMYLLTAAFMSLVPLLMAGAVVLTLPVLIMFIVAQRYFFQEERGRGFLGR